MDSSFKAVLEYCVLFVFFSYFTFGIFYSIQHLLTKSQRDKGEGGEKNQGDREMKGKKQSNERESRWGNSVEMRES